MTAGVDFYSPSMRASASDLAISVSPLGLIELADEEFEVHGPRINRYAQNWAFYLGHHWAYKRQFGDAQLVFNYVEAFANYINNFTFGRGVHFQSAKEFQHIVPALLRRIWEVDNNKSQTLWDMGQQGGVSGDCFVKVAYDPAWEDPAGFQHPGRVRILPLNSSFCFPEYHPHDRDRLIRFKMKYRFWGTSLEGTRQVYTYTEILTDDLIQEFVNDELIDERPNPIGTIPVVHIRNIPISGSPWGLSDINSIVALNREFNEKATDISDIINYHAAPVTIVTGAKVSNLEKSARKVWGGLPKDANVFNLENGVDLAGPLEFLEQIKRSMHELTGVPETALGQLQPISNTSGVALAIQFMPMMMRYSMKKREYTAGLKRINELALRTLFLFEPETVRYDPDTEGIIQEGQPLVINPDDPLVTLTECEWPPPLPTDVLVKLNEIQAKMALGLESKRGALRDLGEEFADEKLEEIFEELVEDAKDQGALDLIKSQINSAILALTGMVPEGPEPQDQENNDAPGSSSSNSSPSGAGVTVNPQAAPPFADITGPETQKLLADLVTQAYGTKLAQRRNPENQS
jgi:hypothetical protein